jgi:hypothetical protein
MEAEPNLIQRLQIKVVPESELPVGYKPVTIALSLRDPDMQNMWANLRTDGGALATVKGDRITFWRLTAKPAYIGKRKGPADLSGP